MLKPSIFSLLIVMGTLPAWGQALNLSRNFRPDPLQVQGVTRGAVGLATLAGSASGCRGFGQNQPNHLINISDSFPMLDLIAFTRDVNQDLTMLIKGSDGTVWCGDDEYRGRSPRVSARLPRGAYQVWIGSGEAGRAVNYTLSVSETPHK